MHWILRVTFLMDLVDAGDTINQTAYCQDLAQIMNAVISLLSLRENLFPFETCFHEGGVCIIIIM